jgi:hypothetical protein
MNIYIYIWIVYDIQDTGYVTQIHYFHKLVLLCVERPKLFFMFHITCKNICMDSEYNSAFKCNETQYFWTQMETQTNIPQTVTQWWRDLKAIFMQNNVCVCVFVFVSIIHCPPRRFHLFGTNITYCSKKKWYKQTSN